MQSSHNYSFTHKKTNMDISEYTFNVSQSVLCRTSSNDGPYTPASWYYINYIDTAPENIVGRGFFGTVYNITPSYKCAAASFTEITTTEPLVVKIQNHCACGIRRTPPCDAQHNPTILSLEESRTARLRLISRTMHS